VQDTAADRVYPWPATSATGVGSMPGTDPAEAIAVILGELPGLPHIPELPARGPGSDLTGRTAALLLDLPVETTARGWKLTTRPGRDQRRAAGAMSADLDAVQEAAEDYHGTFKIQACGPWTLAATLELSRSQDPALADAGALGDLTASLAEGIAAHVAQVRGRIPGATVVLQLDEPALPAVMAGAIPTASGLNRVPAVDAAVAADGLRGVLRAATAFCVVHSCAPDTPFQMIKESGAGAVGFDASLLRRDEEDAVAEAVEAGIAVMLGGLPITNHAKQGRPSPSPTPRQTATAALTLWHRMGIAPARFSDQVVLTPACGLAGASPAEARAAIAHCREAAGLVPELIEEGVT
jgi:hypothetical protein